MSGTQGLAGKILVIAYGNPLRSDDGIAWQAAEELRPILPASASVICVHQLTPELAETASHSETVIFLDAATNNVTTSVVCEPLSQSTGEPGFSHHLSPKGVLELCERLYSTRPRGFLVSISGQCFNHGEDLSPAAIQAIPQVLTKVGELLSGLSRA